MKEKEEEKARNTKRKQLAHAWFSLKYFRVLNMLYVKPS
jgi:hypothetical protein